MFRVHYRIPGWLGLPILLLQEGERQHKVVENTAATGTTAWQNKTMEQAVV